MSDRFVGVDAGGSRTTAVVVDASGTELTRAESGPSGFQDGGPEIAAAAIRALVSELAEADGSRPARMVCAMAGGGRRGPAEALRQLLVRAGIAGEVAVVTDADAALHAAFGDGPGIVVIAGTGSIAVGRGTNGQIARAGGSRPLGGDPGSGEWIGLEAIRCGLAVDRGAARDAIAEIALSVGAAADAGDPKAAALVRRAAEALAALVFDVETVLAPSEEAPLVALAGGLLDPGRPVRKAVTAVLGRESPGSEVLPDRVDGALGAARLALRGGFGSREKP